MAAIDDLLDQASEIRDADQEKENTAMRVGTMLINILQHVAKFVDTETLEQILNDYVSLERNLIRWRQSRIVCLASMGNTLDNIDGGTWSYTEHDKDVVYSETNKVLRVSGEAGNYSVLPGVVYVNLHTGHSYTWNSTTREMVELTDSRGPVVIDYRNTPRFENVAVGETYYYESGTTRRIAIKVSSSSSHSFEIDPGAIYAFRDVRKVMIWNAGSSTWVPVGGDSGGFKIANDLDTSDPTQALSARQGKILKGNVDALWAKVNALINDLAAMAFTGTKTQVLGPIDWTGGAFYATIVKTLSGCSTQNMNTEQVAEGQQFSMVLSALTGYTLTGADISVTDSKGQSVAYTFDNNTLTIAAANVVGTITVSVVAVGVISVSLGGGSSKVAFTSGTPTEATTGSSWTGAIEAERGYKLPESISVTMGGNPVTPAYDSTSGAITIANVTGNIVITAVAILDIGNVMFDNVRILGGSNGQGFALVGPHEEACITPLIEVPSGSSIEFSNGGTDGKNPITFYDENGDYVNCFSNNAAPRTVNMVAGAKFIRLSVPKANLSAAYIKVDNNVAWSYDNDTMLSYDMFLNSSYCPQPNARGDYEGCLPWMSYIGLETPVANSLTNSRMITNATLRILLPKNGARDISEWPYVFCKMVEIPSDKEISFKAGELTGSDKLPYLQLYQKSDGEELKRSFYDLAASSSGVDAETMVRQVTVPNEYTHCSLVAKYEQYKNGEAYIKATSTNETLWSNK